jgi:hypothetical protein
MPGDCNFDTYKRENLKSPYEERKTNKKQQLNVYY